jgi:hypothetical protein
MHVAMLNLPGTLVGLLITSLRFFFFRSHENMSVLLLDSIVDKHAIDIEDDYLKMVKVSFFFLSAIVRCTLITTT